MVQYRDDDDWETYPTLLLFFKCDFENNFAVKNNQFDTHYQNCSNSRSTTLLILNYLELYQMIWSKSVIFCVPAVLVPSQLNLFPRFCILGEFDIFGNIGFFDCFKPNCVFVFLFVVDCLWLVCC